MTRTFALFILSFIFVGTTQAAPLWVNAVDSAGNAVKYAVETAEKGALQEYQPSKIRQWANYLKQNKSQIALTQMKHFPIEAFSFFVALGALSAKDLIFNYADNPAAADQFLASQADPVGQVAFAAFMMANGYTAQPLMAVVESPKLRGFIPYFGMSVGMFASNVVHEIAHIASMKSCSENLKKEKSDAQTDKSCDEAFSVFSKEYFSEKGHEFAPSLVSMLLSTYAAGKTEQLVRAGIIKAGQESAALRMRLIAVEFAFTFAPGGVMVRGARWVGKIAQIAGFVYLDTLIHDPMVFAWKNAIQVGPELDHLRKEVLSPTTKIDEKEKSLEGFTKKMKSWRETNMTEVLRAHSNWTYFLAQITAQYSTAKSFYSDFISDVRTKLFENRSETSVLDRAFPLYGIKPNFESARATLPLSLPTQYEAAQLRNLIYISEQIEGDFYNSQPWMRILPAQTLSEIQKIVKDLRSTKPNVINSAYQSIRRLSLFGDSHQIRQYFKARVDELGILIPKNLPGQGYTANLADFYKSQNMNLELVSKYRNPLALELTQMITGPDVEAGETLVKKNLSGFLDEFYGPQVRIKGEIKTYQHYKVDVPTLDDYVFTHQLEISGKKYPGSIFQALSSQAIRPHILGSKSQPGFTTWWEKYAETEYIKAWTDYEEKYEKIMLDLHKALWKQDRSVFNRSTYSNGVFDSLRQEREFYLDLAKSLIKTTEDFSGLEKELSVRISKAEKLFAGLQPKFVQSRKVLVSTISNQQFQSTFESIHEVIENLQAVAAESLISSQNEKLLTKAFEALKASLSEFSNLTQIMNAASYIENHQEGIAKKKRCLAQPGTAGSMKSVQAKMQGCE